MNQPTTITIQYGERSEGAGNAKYSVEFKLDHGKLMGRYLDPAGEWEERQIVDADDIEHVAVITALNTLLAAYSGQLICPA